jgi:drug/metabolite transporter (DMT)-like permease
MRSAPTSETLTIAYLGIFPGAIAFFLVALSLKKYRLSIVSSYLFLIPFITSLIAWIAINEAISSKALFGGLFIILGILIKNKIFNSPKSPSRIR